MPNKSIRSRLADSVEAMVRNRRRQQIIYLMTGVPLIGVLVGLVTAGLTFLACLAPTPYEFIIAGSIIAVALVVSDGLVMKLEEPVGDLVNRGFTRVFRFTWIPHPNRPRVHLVFEPWRTTVVLSLFWLTIDRSTSTDLELWMWWSSLSWLAKGAALGVGVALVKSLFQLTTWRALLRKGPNKSTAQL